MKAIFNLLGDKIGCKRQNQTNILNRNIQIKKFEGKHVKYLILAFTVDIELRLAFAWKVFLFQFYFVIKVFDGYFHLRIRIVWHKYYEFER